jgi:DNA-binding transcriptional LysR family regulator
VTPATAAGPSSPDKRSCNGTGGATVMQEALLEGVAEFVAVADAGGFSAASRRLGTPKASLSERVARLEERLGARLFHRTTRQLALTEAGRVYLDHGRRMLGEAALAGDALQALRAEPRGQVRVTTSVLFATAHLAPMLPAFWARHPQVGVDVIADDRVRDLAGEAVDVAIRFAHLETNPSAIGRRLAPLRFVLCAAPSYLERRGVPLHPDDLRGHDCILHRAPVPQAWNEWSFERRDGGNRPLDVRATGPVCADAGIVLRAMALAGCGIAKLATVNAGDDLRAGRLVRVLPDWPLAGLERRAIWAVYTGNRAIPPKVRAFVDFLAERIGDPPYWDRGL